jgi:hypothetical protein
MSCNIALRRSPNPDAFTARNQQCPAQLVYDESRQSLSLDLLGDNQKRLATFGDLLKERKDVFHGTDFLLINQDVGILEGNFHAFRVRNEVRGKVSAVELHAFHNFKLGLQRLRLLDGNDAVLADLLHRIGDDLADSVVIVGGNAANLRDHVPRNWLGEFAEFTVGARARPGADCAANRGDGLFNSAFHRYRIGSGSDSSHAFVINGLRQNGGRGGPVASDVAGLGSTNFSWCGHTRPDVLSEATRVGGCSLPVSN